MGRGDAVGGLSSVSVKGRETMPYRKPYRKPISQPTVRVSGDTIRFGSGPSGVEIQFQRTLRIPDDGRSYALPPGFGPFPVRRVDDYLDRVPEEWRERGGVFVPMYQREAMWLLFRGQYWKPRAVKIAVGKVCAITGERWSESLHQKGRGFRSTPQDYIVTPPQPWLDGICTGKGMIRQFVAMPLGMGYTVEGQVTGEERFGGIQIKVFEPRAGRFPDAPPPPPMARARASSAMGGSGSPSLCAAAPMGAPGSAPRARGQKAGSMGLAAGGRMKQKIYRDPHGLKTWDQDNTSRVFVHIVNSELFREITGDAPPPSPVTAREYAASGLPWFDLYDENASAVKATKILKGVKSIKELDEDNSSLPLQDDDPVSTGPIVSYTLDDTAIRDGNW